MTIIIGGGTGFVGSALTVRLKHLGYSPLIISRNPKGKDQMSWKELEAKGLPDKYQAVINVAGENILNPLRRWNDKFKADLRESRIWTTKLLSELVIKSSKDGKKPKLFISTSAVGYYPPSETAVYNEDYKAPVQAVDFLQQLCIDWEKAAEIPKDVNVRHVVVRSGIVLGRGGGMIQQMIYPFFFGLGGPVGSGKQFLPWIHIEDICGIHIHAIRDGFVSGVMNGVSPNCVTNAEFTNAFAKALHRCACFSVPRFALNVAYGAERAKVMNEGQHVQPKQTLELGYQFKYAAIEDACRELARLGLTEDERMAKKIRSGKL